MISDEALAALHGVEDGARYNTLHSTARELINAGLACDDWGYLGLTESGRSFLRRGKFDYRKIAINCDDMSDLSVHAMQIPDAEIDRTAKTWWKNRAVDPMMSPQHVHAAEEPLELPPELPPEPLPIAETRRQEMLRAAGVASGATGVWVDEKWVEEFIRALDQPTGYLEASFPA